MRSVMTRMIPGVAGVLLLGLTFVLAALGWVRPVEQGPVGVVTRPGRARTVEEGWAPYYTSLNLTGESVSSDVLHFDQQNISVDISCWKEGVSSTGSGTFRIELHRVTLGFVDDFVSAVNVSRDGSSTATWEGVGAGEYYLRFVKDDDGQTVRTRALVISGVDLDS